MMADRQANNNKEDGERTHAMFAWTWLVMLLLIAAFLRVHNADYFYYSADEAMHSNIASGQSLQEVWKFAHYEIHPPLSYFFYHYWMKFSSDPAFVRTLSLLVGLLLIPLYYRIGQFVAGESAGVTCATLVAFSHGCIIQSYVVRQYIFLLLFASLAFYCYLHWYHRQHKKILLAYAACGVLTVLSHFSGILFFLCLGSFEMSRLIRLRLGLQTCILWVIANGIIFLAALAIYDSWQPIMLPLHSYFSAYFLPLTQRLWNTLFYAKVATDYIYPVPLGSYFIFPAVAAYIVAQDRKFQAKHTLSWANLGLTGISAILLSFGLYLIFPIFIVCARYLKYPNIARSIIILAVIACGLGAVLYLTQLYPPFGTRRSLWMFPFVLVATAIILADVLGRLLLWLIPESRLRPQFLSLILLLAGCLSYNESDRFSDGSEYAMPMEQWTALNGYLATLSPSDMIIAEKDDGIMLANLYQHMGNDVFNGMSMAAILPYRNTHIVFNPYYPRNYSRDVFMATLYDARNKHMFDGIDRLIFLRLAWARSPLTDLMLCDTLEKHIYSFPALNRTHLTRDDIYGSFAAVMVVNKDAFLRDVMVPGGTARACLNGKHDMVPGFKPEPNP